MATYRNLFFLLVWLVPISTLVACAADNSSKKLNGPKWHPGHYLSGFYGNGSPPGWLVETIKDNATVKGISLIHLWPDLEPSKDVYDFSTIERELDALRAVGKQLIIQINDKTFQEKRQPCVPSYLLKDPVFQGGQNLFYSPQGRFMSCVALRWVPEVQDRLIALYRALGKRFDSDPNLEAITLEEDAVSQGGNNFHGYSSENYTIQQKRGMKALAESFPNTIVYKFLNWGPNVKDLFEYAYELGLGVGGPDLIPGSNNFAYPQYKAYAGKMPLQISVAWPGIENYIKKGGELEKAYEFGINDPEGLHVNHIVWDPVDAPMYSFKRQVLPLINARKGNINEGLPINRRRATK